MAVDQPAGRGVAEGLEFEFSIGMLSWRLQLIEYWSPCKLVQRSVAINAEGKL